MSQFRLNKGGNFCNYEKFCTTFLPSTFNRAANSNRDLILRMKKDTQTLILKLEQTKPNDKLTY